MAASRLELAIAVSTALVPDVTLFDTLVTEWRDSYIREDFVPLIRMVLPLRVHRVAIEAFIRASTFESKP